MLANRYTPPMTRMRRGIALLATFAVLGTALWPLVSSWAAEASGEAVPLCHQAGMQVDAASAPLPAESGDRSPAGKTHCPLCVMVFFAAFGPALAAPTFVSLALHVEDVALPAPLRRSFAVALPGSRAPPHLAA
jgi:MFS family permease